MYFWIKSFVPCFSFTFPISWSADVSSASARASSASAGVSFASAGVFGGTSSAAASFFLLALCA